MFDIFYIGNKPDLFAHEQPAESIEHAQSLARTRYFWVVNYLADYTDWDWLWEPVPWQANQRHAWASQWQKDSGTYLVPTAGYTDTNYHETPRIRTGITRQCYLIDHSDNNIFVGNVSVRRIRYVDNYLDTLKRVARHAAQEQLQYVWVCSTVCDYHDFDFDWHPDPWQQELLHVFPSDDQKFGDTFLMHVPSFLERIHTRELLEWYDLNFVAEVKVPRWPIPVIRHNCDTQVDAVQVMPFIGPVALYTTRNELPADIPAVNLWRERTKTITPLSPNKDTALVPKSAVNQIQTQMYDYPYINKTHSNLMNSRLQDIVFISYDEPEADANYAKLLEQFPRAKRVHGVKGMENALAAAAEVSDTPWYFAVFGKTELYPGFDFTFQPDYFQQPKHYIFYSKNRVNGLVYGEMAVIMYNCRLILDNREQEFGLDYTMSFPHEVIPEISTYGNFDTSPYHAWRTAFREVSKLYDIQSRTPSVETQYRIGVWETTANSDYAEWVLNGARDGREFFLKYQDDFDYRKNSFDWQWLRDYFESLYGKTL